MKIAARFLLLSYFLCNPLYADSMGGAVWTSIRIETNERDTLVLKITDGAENFTGSHLSIYLKQPNCRKTYRQVPIEGLPDLSAVQFYRASDDLGEFNILSIVSLEATRGKQVHRRTNISLRKCKLEDRESYIEKEFPG